MPSVLVTGAARGIGKSIVEQLAATGWDVVAGVRTEADAAAVTALNPQRISAIVLDVTDADDIAALEQSLPAHLDAVVNNAGIVVAGPVETLTSDDWRKQFEVNVIGQFAVARAALPRLRESHGRLVFVSSVNGRLSTPMVGAYAASKFALEAGADALRMELRPWNVPVVLIEPAQTDTDMWRKADDMVVELEAAASPAQLALYDRHIAGMKKMIPLSQKMAVPTAKVVAVVQEALTAKRPKARYIVGLGPKAQVALVTHLPAFVRDRLLGLMFGTPR